jgi:murein DD-endopeptidase MepM/ murein hydrolase activator NlpD
MNRALLILLYFIITAPLFASHVQIEKWKKGETYLMFLEKMDIPQALYYDSDKEDQKLTEEIISGINFQLMYNDSNSLEQVLIPINDELQLHIYKNKKGIYQFDTLPIISETRTESFILRIEKSPYQDILKVTHSKRIAQLFASGFKNSLNFRRDLRKGDILAMVYEQKYRLGKEFSIPILKVAMIEMRKKRHFIYLNSDEHYYDETGNEIRGFFLHRPVTHARISSRFTKRRFHPILKRYRAHLGVDYAARRGTPILAAASGRISFAGYTRGYGNLIKISHTDGYMTLYAHQKKFKRGIKRGKYVKKGQVIGYIGTTGLSTGPHLHFGLYKNGRAVNPAGVIRVSTKRLSGSKLKNFNIIKKSYDKNIETMITNNIQYDYNEPMQNSCEVTLQPLKEEN